MRAAFAGALLLSCQASDPETAAPEAPATEQALRELLAVPDHFETPRIPDYNPVTAEKLELGRHLFYDRRLSGNGTKSCADCHPQATAFSDGFATSEGANGELGLRNAQPLVNVAWFGTLTWAHHGFTDLEEQLEVPLIGDRPVELGINDGNQATVFARFDEDPLYQDLLAAAFPESDSGLTLPKITFALSHFVRSLLSGSSAFDRYLLGDTSALTEQQRKGLTLFNGERFECFHCHGGTHFTQSYRDQGVEDEDFVPVFFNTGLYNVDGEGSYPLHDQGLFELTFDPDDRGRFRPQGLRNVALTAPYMHDGSLPTLRDVLAFYQAGGRVIEEGPFAGDGRVSPLKSGLIRPFEATEEEIDAVIAFLESLTDEAFLHDPRFADPFAPDAP